LRLLLTLPHLHSAVRKEKYGDTVPKGEEGILKPDIEEFLGEEAFSKYEGSVGVDTCDERIDMSSTKGKAVSTEELTHEGCRRKIEDIFKRHAAHREIFYRTLVFCQERHRLEEIEEEIATYPEFKHAAQSQYHFIHTLEDAGGLTRIELDEVEDEVTPERKAGLDADEVDELVCDYGFETTGVGREVVEAHDPVKRLLELLGIVPSRKQTYIELMDFCKDNPRTYTEVGQFLEGRDALSITDNTLGQSLQPSVFLDKLESAHGVVWNDGWILTEEGRRYLAALGHSAA
jgi:hypothetical protein